MFLELLIIDNKPCDYVRSWAFTPRQINDLQLMDRKKAIKWTRKTLKIHGKSIVGIRFDRYNDTIQYYDVYCITEK